MTIVHISVILFVFIVFPISLFQKIHSRLVRAEIEAGVWRLVVCHVLCGDAQAVWYVLHEAVDAVICGDGGYVYAQFAAVFGACDDLFAPVAENVSAETRV